MSDDDQGVKSVEQQIEVARERISSENWILSDKHIYQDHGISGQVNVRAQFLEMMAAAQRHEFSVLVVWAMSRLGRNYNEANRNCDILNFEGVRVVSVVDGYDSDSKNARSQQFVINFKNAMFIDELSASVHRGNKQLHKQGKWTGGRPYGYTLKPEYSTNPSDRDPYGNPKRIGTYIVVNPDVAPIVVRVFTRFAEGASYRNIAGELNAEKIPSPGSSHTGRKQLRRAGWVVGSVRNMLKSPLYTGRVLWNRSKVIRHPITGKKVFRERPQNDWVERYDASLRIVPDDVWNAVQKRFTVTTVNKVKSGGKPRYVLSGLLRCKQCNGRYIINHTTYYVCANYQSGKVCSNNRTVKRHEVEREVLGGINIKLLEPKRVERWAEYLDEQLRLGVRESASKANDAPDKLKVERARLAKFRERLNDGDPEMAGDELLAVIALLEEKVKALQSPLPSHSEIAEALRKLPKSAQLYREEIRLGLDGDVAQAAKARNVLRSVLVGGQIVLENTADGRVAADFTVNPAGFLQRPVNGHTVTSGNSTDTVSPFHIRVFVK
jgi:DNA invertase Pin-like site-specific DNA recombinase